MARSLSGIFGFLGIGLIGIDSLRSIGQTMSDTDSSDSSEQYSDQAPRAFGSDRSAFRSTGPPGPRPFGDPGPYDPPFGKSKPKKHPKESAPEQPRPPAPVPQAGSVFDEFGRAITEVLRTAVPDLAQDVDLGEVVGFLYNSFPPELRPGGLRFGQQVPGYPNYGYY
jgi:hypothetical protein